ncbi:MAG: hypothetical protein ACFB8W_09625 [Elainellaceae cyanobacterium]
MTASSIFVLAYLAIALIFAVVLTLDFLRDTSTPNTDRASWTVVAIAAALWAVVIPISLVQRSESCLGGKDRLDNARSCQDHYSAL